MKNKNSGKFLKLFLLLLGLIAGVYAVGMVQNIVNRAAGVGPATYKGTLVVTALEGKSTDQTRYRYYIQIDNTTLKEVDPALVALYKPGSTVTVSGNVNTQGILAPAVSSQSLTTTSAITTQAAAVPVTGTRRLAVILVNFNNDVLAPAVTKTATTSFLTGQLIPFYKENSFNKMNITGSVYGPYNLSVAASCSTSVFNYIALDAISKADPDVDFTKFDHIMFVFPNHQCGFTGYANVGSKNLYHVADGGTGGSYVGLYPSWIPDSLFNLRTVSHEFGHNLGLKHAAGRDCGDNIVGDSTVCYDNEYVDYWDTMGDKSPRHFSSFRKEYLGWLTTANVKTITTSGTYDIQPLETLSSLPQTLKIQGTSPSDNSFYYLESRASTGFDSGIESSAASGLVIRKYPVAPQYFGQFDSAILDMTPNSGSGEEDFKDAALGVGQTFTDPKGGPQGNGLTIKVISKTNNVTKVQISFGPKPTADLKIGGQDGPIWVIVDGFVPFTPKNGTISWTSSFTKSCTGMWWDMKAPKTLTLNGSETYLINLGRYTLTCTGNDGSTISDTVSVQANRNYPLLTVKPRPTPTP